MPNEVASVTENWLFNWKRSEHRQKKKQAYEEKRVRGAAKNGEKKMTITATGFWIGMVSADGKIERFQKCASFIIHSHVYSYTHILRSIGQLVINYHCMNWKNVRLRWTEKKIFECNYSVESARTKCAIAPNWVCVKTKGNREEDERE